MALCAGGIVFASDDLQKTPLIFKSNISNVNSWRSSFFRNSSGITGSFHLHPKNDTSQVHAGVILPQIAIDNLIVTLLYRNKNNTWVEIPFPGYQASPRLFKRENGRITYVFAINSAGLEAGKYKARFSIKYDDEVIEYGNKDEYGNQGSQDSPPFYVIDVVDERQKTQLVYDELLFSRQFEDKDVFSRKVLELLEGNKLNGRDKLYVLSFLGEFIPIENLDEESWKNQLILWLLRQKYINELRLGDVPYVIIRRNELWDKVAMHEDDIKQAADDLSRKYFPDVKPDYDIHSIDFNTLEKEVLSRKDSFGINPDVLSE
jgi:hypothetical protein